MRSEDVWQEEGILLSTDDKISKKYPTDVEGAIVSCIKHARRYGEQWIAKEIWLKILFYAYKGYHCKEDHFCSAQRHALYNYLKDKEITDPYIQQFMKESG